MTLRDAKIGDQVISNAWTDFTFGSTKEGDNKHIPRELIVIEKPKDKDCVWCRPVDGTLAERVPLWSGLVCRVVV